MKYPLFLNILLKNVDSFLFLLHVEFEEYIHQDSWRINHVYSETCDPSHPHAKFYVGKAAIIISQI